MKRLFLLLVVSAMMLSVSALPAFAGAKNGNGATVIPKTCFNDQFPDYRSSCEHLSSTPSGNVNETLHFHL